MTNNSTFTLSFRVTHPSLPAAEIVEVFGLSVSKFQSVGEPRLTKSGVVLGGNYKETNVGFRLHDEPIRHEDVFIDDFIQKHIESIDTEYLAHLDATNGSCGFSLGVFTDGNVDFVLTNETIEMLSAARMTIWFDIYDSVD